MSKNKKLNFAWQTFVCMHRMCIISVGKKQFKSSFNILIGFRQSCCIQGNSHKYNTHITFTSYSNYCDHCLCCDNFSKVQYIHKSIHAIHNNRNDGDFRFIDIIIFSRQIRSKTVELFVIDSVSCRIVSHSIILLFEFEWSELFIICIHTGG